MTMVLIQCKVSPGAFSGELQFEIALNGEKHVGLASRRYFVTTENKPLGEIKGEMPAYVFGRVLDEDDGKALVSIPDGEVVSVKPDKLVMYSEPKNVPVGS